MGSFTKDEYVPVTPGQGGTVVLSANPFAQTDYSMIIRAFEIEASNWQEEDYAKCHHYRDVYSTRNFAQRTRDQMNYYPGMHQTNWQTEEDPMYTNAKRDAEQGLAYWDHAMSSPEMFMAGMKSRQKDFDYRQIFGKNVSGKDRATEVAKMLAECIPCIDRFPALLPDADLLEIHAMNIKIRTDLLDKIMALFKDPGVYLNICDLLKLLTHLCPQDLLKILALLTQYLAKLNLDFRFNLDFIIQLVGPILSPFLDALSQWLDKWIQLILGPMLCVLDHINETILVAQSMEIPLSSVTADVEMDLGVAAPAHQSSAGNVQFHGKGGTRETKKAHAWGSWQWEQFNTPDSEKYNPSEPVPPAEETQMAMDEMSESWNPEFSEAERAERDARWEELRSQEQKKRMEVPPPLERPAGDGTRWSKDDIPDSEKYKTGDSWQTGYYPPEKQDQPNEGVEYYVTTPLVNSIVQLRNIMQGALQYVKDWFTYVTQMVHDLLGTDFGWMNKKTDNTMLKSRILQMIMLVKAVLQAISNNGLECGMHTNFDEGQLKYILEDRMNSFSTTEFKVMDDGTIGILPPGSNVGPEPEDVVDDIPDDAVTPDEIDGLVPGETITEPKKPKDEQKFVQSGIIIKDCFRSVTKEEVEQVRNWIADFEKRGNS